jgi:REP element-mobilizing transposase RayT
MARGIERGKIFKGEPDYADFLGRMEAVVSSTGVEVLAWALLPNHFHLLMRTRNVPLPSVMRRVMTGYAGAFNRRHRRHGHLFQNRYKSIVCEEEAYLLELVRYIHLNPLRANVVKEFGDLEGHPYSGHSALVGRIERPWQAVEEVLGRFGGTVEDARRAYEGFVLAGAGQGRRPELVGGGLRRSCGEWLDLPTRKGQREAVAHDARVLGAPEFVADLLADADWERRQLLRARTRARVEEVGALAARVGGITEAELRSGARRRSIVAAREALAQVAINELGHTGAAVARYLGVAPSTVNRRAVSGTSSFLAKALLEALSGP